MVTALLSKNWKAEHKWKQKPHTHHSILLAKWNKKANLKKTLTLATYTVQCSKSISCHFIWFELLENLLNFLYDIWLNDVAAPSAKMKKTCEQKVRQRMHYAYKQNRLPLLDISVYRLWEKDTWVSKPKNIEHFIWNYIFHWFMFSLPVNRIDIFILPFSQYITSKKKQIKAKPKSPFLYKFLFC